jgi:hypothetical protein
MKRLTTFHDCQGVPDVHVAVQHGEKYRFEDRVFEVILLLCSMFREHILKPLWVRYLSQSGA